MSFIGSNGLKETGSRASEGSKDGRRGATRALLWFGLTAVAAVGLFARMKGLGFAPLAVDEYYFLTSARTIVDHGVPWLPGGGYYTRGLLLQYLTVPPLIALDDAELAVRLPSLLFGIGTVVLGYLYGRRVLGRPMALLLVAFLLLSSWEVEFSRFGRMYAGFQFFSLAYFIALYEILRDASAWRPLIPVILLLAAVLSHSLAMFLAPTLFLPLLVPGIEARFRGRRAAVRHALVSTFVSLAILVYWRIDFRLIGVTDPFPAGYEPLDRGNPIDLPSYPFWSIADERVLNLVFAVLLVVLIAGIAVLFARRRSERPWLYGVATAMVTSAALHQLGLTLLCAVILIGWYRIHRQQSRNTFAIGAMVGATLLSLGWAVYATWLTYGVGDRSWIGRTGEEVFRYAVFEAFAWPDPYPVLLHAWGTHLPLIGTLILLSVLFQVLTKLRHRPQDNASNPAFILVYFFLALGVVDPRLHSPRYSHFLYPLGLTALIMSVDEVIRRLAKRWAPIRMAGPGAVTVTLAAGIFIMSADFNLRHLLTVDSPETTFRLGEFHRFSGLWYPRRDSDSPAEFVENRARPGEPVVLVEMRATMGYLDPSALYLPRWSDAFAIESREQGTMDFWSGRRLLSTPEELCRFTDRASVVWLVQASEASPEYARTAPFTPPGVWSDRLLGWSTEYTNLDRTIEVLRVELDASRNGPCASP